MDIFNLTKPSNAETLTFHIFLEGRKIGAGGSMPGFEKRRKFVKFENKNALVQNNLYEKRCGSTKRTKTVSSPSDKSCSSCTISTLYIVLFDGLDLSGTHPHTHINQGESKDEDCAHTVARCLLKVAPRHEFSSQGQSFSFAHSKTSTCAPSAARLHVFSSQGHPFSLAHLRTSRCPADAAPAHVRSSQGHP